MRRDRWPVISDAAFRENIPQGWSISILCMQSDPREIMSANGVIAFLSELGFMTPSVPLVVGSSVELGPEQRTAPGLSED